MSRSQLYQRALTAYLENHEAMRVSEALSMVYGQEPSRLDPRLKKAQAKSLKKNAW